MGTALNSPECSRGVWMKALNTGPPSQPAPLFATPGHLLDKFIKDFLQPNKHFLDQIAAAVDVICKFLQQNCFRHSATKVQKTAKVSAGLSPPRFLSSAVPARGRRAREEGGERGRWAPRTAALSGVARTLLWLCVSFWGLPRPLVALALDVLLP